MNERGDSRQKWYRLLILVPAWQIGSASILLAQDLFGDPQIIISIQRAHQRRVAIFIICAVIPKTQVAKLKAQ